MYLENTLLSIRYGSMAQRFEGEIAMPRVWRATRTDPRGIATHVQ
jgi:hypothetical protein